MANNYCHFSSWMDIPREKKDLAGDVIAKAYEELEDSGFYFGGTLVDIECDNTRCGVWFRDDESGDIEAVEFIARKLIDTLEIDEPFYCSYAYTCSKPRIDEFNGGAFVVKRYHETYWCDAMQTVREWCNKIFGGV